jgi:hypothetical protein
LAKIFKGHGAGREIGILRSPAEGPYSFLVATLAVEKYAVIIVNLGLLRAETPGPAKSGLREFRLPLRVVDPGQDQVRTPGTVIDLKGRSEGAASPLKVPRVGVAFREGHVGVEARRLFLRGRALAPPKA